MQGAGERGASEAHGRQGEGRVWNFSTKGILRHKQADTLSWHVVIIYNTLGKATIPFASVGIILEQIYVLFQNDEAFILVISRSRNQ